MPELLLERAIEEAKRKKPGQVLWGSGGTRSLVSKVVPNFQVAAWEGQRAKALSVAPAITGGRAQAAAFGGDPPRLVAR
jgi:hypothetical protein